MRVYVISEMNPDGSLVRSTRIGGLTDLLGEVDQRILNPESRSFWGVRGNALGNDVLTICFSPFAEVFSHNSQLADIYREIQDVSYFLSPSLPSLIDPLVWDRATLFTADVDDGVIDTNSLLAWELPGIYMLHRYSQPAVRYGPTAAVFRLPNGITFSAFHSHHIFFHLQQ